MGWLAGRDDGDGLLVRSAGWLCISFFWAPLALYFFCAMPVELLAVPQKKKVELLAACGRPRPSVPDAHAAVTFPLNTSDAMWAVPEATRNGTERNS